MEVGWDTQSCLHIVQCITDHVKYSIVLRPTAIKRIRDWHFTILQMVLQQKEAEFKLDKRQAICVTWDNIQFIDTAKKRCITCSPHQWVELLDVLKQHSPAEPSTKSDPEHL